MRTWLMVLILMFVSSALAHEVYDPADKEALARQSRSDAYARMRERARHAAPGNDIAYWQGQVMRKAWSRQLNTMPDWMRHHHR